MNNIFDALEICLSEIENGADVETVLARFPSLAGELRPILETSVKARNMVNADPSPETVRRGRARVMQRAAEIRESRVAPRKRVIPAFQRLALSFSMAAMLLLSGTGLLSASASALPGEKLYPVKRTWEGVRLFLVFDQQARTLLEDQFEYERLHEVNELLVEGRDETIQFAGVFMIVNGKSYISGVPVLLPSNILMPASGSAVVISGNTNPQGVVEVISLELLPDGSVVPVGKPVEVDTESGSDSGSGSENESSGSGDASHDQPAVVPTAVAGEDSKYYSMEGTLQSVSPSTLVINQLTVYPDNAKIKGDLCPGVRVEVKGYFDKDGGLIVSEVEAKGSCPAGSGNSGNSNSSSNSNQGSSSNDNSNTGDNNSNNDDSSGNGNDNSGDDHGGSGGGNSNGDG